MFDGFVRWVTGDCWSHVLEEAILPLNAAGLCWPIRFPTYINIWVTSLQVFEASRVSYCYARSVFCENICRLTGIGWIKETLGLPQRSVESQIWRSQALRQTQQSDATLDISFRELCGFNTSSLTSLPILFTYISHTGRCLTLIMWSCADERIDGHFGQH